MINLVWMLRRKDGISKHDFIDYYENHHAELAKQYFGHLYHDYQRIYVNETFVSKANAHSFSKNEEKPYDCITNIVFKNQDDLDKFFLIASDPDVIATMKSDESNFLDDSDVSVYVCNAVRTWTASDLDK